MPVETTYSNLRQNLASTLDQVVDDQEIVIVRRRASGPAGSRDVALIPARELAALLETARLLSSDRNAARLLSALKRAERGSGKPRTVVSLKREMGLRVRTTRIDFLQARYHY
ncbi:MAG: type II toxin-antitoxin system prevent-host-death family antitoxin [Acidobacteriota bacterium]